ncbi:acyltransferase family protein [Sinosporangium siamense]|uniref:acyltransferase family protein n=1 Tax=Sinosporangium siamense TaxID=1367973 RepID=UPI00194E7B24|nr:acyltransferase [Sinosporangium siamense]
MDARDDLPPLRGHQNPLDGIRALAAFGVLVLHVAGATGAAYQDSLFSWLLSRGDAGVAVFFTLSGLLLYRPWAVALVYGGPAPATRDYLWRRALRVLPAYWVAIVVGLLLFSPEHVRSVGTWVQWLLLVQIYNPDPWWTGTGPEGLYQMWTLPVEAAFYLALPLIALVVAAVAARGDDPARRAGRALWTLTALFAISLVFVFFTFYPEWRPDFGLYLPRYLIWFAPGMMLAVLVAWANAETGVYTPIRRLCRTVASSAGLCWAVAAIAYLVASTELTGSRSVGFDAFWPAMFRTVLYTVIALFVVAPFALGPGGEQGPLGRVVGGPVMRFLGRISYGVFLWHTIVIALASRWLDVPRPGGGFWPALVVVTALSVAVATACYYGIERPARRLGRRRRAVADREPQAGGDGDEGHDGGQREEGGHEVGDDLTGAAPQQGEGEHADAGEQESPGREGQQTAH